MKAKNDFKNYDVFRPRSKRPLIQLPNTHHHITSYIPSLSYAVSGFLRQFPVEGTRSFRTTPFSHFFLSEILHISSGITLGAFSLRFERFYRHSCFGTMPGTTNDTGCWACKKEKIEYMPEPCRCRIYCKRCAMKV